MEVINKKKARQRRYKRKKKLQGFQYLQLWVRVQKNKLNELKTALSKSSSYTIDKFINNYFNDNPESKVFSNDKKAIEKAIRQLLRENPQLSNRIIRQILFDHYKLCTFTRKTHQPTLINPATASKIITHCKTITVDKELKKLQKQY